ncbi:MAG: transposase [Myxococcales bacterium]|nr:transposase [Myxococcales bacterium]
MPLIGEAVGYASRHWDGLSRFLFDGRIPWTNNESERHLRHIVVGRNNWIFRGTFQGAERACVLWSLVMSCKINKLNPRQYLLDTLHAMGTVSHKDLPTLTPRAYAERKRALTQS